MKFLGYAYRFVSNFVFLALVYYSLNLIEKYPQRAMLAALSLLHARMHSAPPLHACVGRQPPPARACRAALRQGPPAPQSQPHCAVPPDELDSGPASRRV